MKVADKKFMEFHSHCTFCHQKTYGETREGAMRATTEHELVCKKNPINFSSSIPPAIPPANEPPKR
jgi:hypothetical protein